MNFASGLAGRAWFGGYAGPYAKPDPEWEKRTLEEQAEAMKSELEAIKKRLAEIEEGVGETKRS